VQRNAGERRRGKRRGVGGCAVELSVVASEHAGGQVPSSAGCAAVGGGGAPAVPKFDDSMSDPSFDLHCECLLAAFSRTGDLIISHLISSFVIGSHFSRRCLTKRRCPCVTACDLVCRSHEGAQERSGGCRALEGPARPVPALGAASYSGDFGGANDSCGHGTPHPACSASTIPPSSVELSSAFLTAVKQRNMLS
jgi:hypothetical protein